MEIQLSLSPFRTMLQAVVSEYMFLKMNAQLAMSRLRTMLPAIIPQSRPRTCTVRKLPPELVDMIFNYLSIPDRICFAISCRYLFACLQSSMETVGWQLPHLLPPEKRPVLGHNAKKRPILQLLHQLQNQRWKFCGECWTLHPRSTTSTAGRLVHSLRKFREQSHCSKCLARRDQFCYLPYTGEVDLCPCLTITFRDKLQLMQICREARESVHDGYEYYYNGVLYHPSHGKLHKWLWHDCTFIDHPFAEVQIRTTIWIEERSISLYVQNVYRFTISERISSQALSSIRCLPCPHKDFGDWLARFFADAGSKFRGCANKHASTPSLNYWDDLERTRPTWKGPRTFEIAMRRDLGNIEWPNKLWDENCCN